MTTLTPIENYRGPVPDLWMLDYDGTLAEGFQMSLESKQGLQILVEKHAEIVLTSARPPENLRTILENAGFEHWLHPFIYISGFNGNLAYLDDKVIQDNPLPLKISGQIAELANRHEITGLFYSAHHICGNNLQSDWIKRYKVVTGYQTEESKPDPNIPFYMIELQVREDNHELIAQVKQLLQQTPNIVSLQFTPPFSLLQDGQWLQITYQGNIGGGGGKGVTTREYQKRLRLQSTVAIGDGINDLDMICLDGVVGIAMENSFAAKKLAVDGVNREVFLTKSVRNHGFLHAVKSIYGV